MLTNFPLATSLDRPNISSQSRAYSMFSKSLQFSNQNGTLSDNTRPSSVSKNAPTFNENNLMKWLPLIKMVRKVQSKVKANCMFFWCRVENLTKIKLQNFNSNKQNQLQELNLPPQVVLQTINGNLTGKTSNFQLIPNSLIQNQSQNKIVESSQLTIQEIKDGFKENDIKIDEDNVQRKIKASKLIKLTQQLLETIERKILRQRFKKISHYTMRKLSLQKFINIQLKQKNRKQLFNVMRMIKKHSHQIMKGEILTNTLKNFIRKTKIFTLHYLVQKTRIFLQSSVKQIFKRKELNFVLDSQNQNINQIQAQNLQTAQPTPIPITILKKLPQNTKKAQNCDGFQKIKQVELEIKLKQSKPLNMKLKKQSQLQVNFKEDKIVQNNFKNKNQHERLKKLSRLHPEEPFFEIPDISQITLFNSTINSNSALFEFLSTKSTHTNFTKSFVINFKSYQQTSLPKHSPHGFFDISPRLKEKSNDTEPNKESVIEKSKGSSKIIYLKNSSSTSLRGNPQTPTSTKKILGVFSKKRSIELLSKDSISKNYDIKLSNCKSSIIKKSNNFIQIKPQQIQESSKRKTTQIHLKQKRNDNTNCHYRSADKQKIVNREICKTEIKTDNSSKKISKSSKVVQKFLDLSAKRMQTVNKGAKKTLKKEIHSAANYEKSSSRKGFNQNQSTKQNQLSEFNTLTGKVISYQQFIQKYPSQRQGSSGRKPLMEISENEPMFQQIHIEQDYNSKDLDFQYQSCSAQLPKERGDTGEAKCKRLRAKIDKIEMNTARKMKLQIENMINQRKKSSIGILKY